MKRLMSVAAALFAALMILTACSTSDIPAPNGKSPPSWYLTLGAGHPLAGRIWQTDSDRYVQADQVQKAVRTADFVLLGEKHDNADHHRLQAWLLEDRLEQGPAIPVAFEMIATDKNSRLEEYIRDHPGDASGLGHALDWEKSGWPDWSIYLPVFQAAMTASAPLIAASQPRSLFRRMIKSGVAAVLGADSYRRLGLDQKFSPAIAAEKRREIIDGHCNMLPGSMVDPMVRVQTVKDAYMADILIGIEAKYGGIGAVLIAGNGHVRNDYGVPWHLTRATHGKSPGKSIVTVGLIEVAADLTDPEDYAARFGGRLPFDFLWFTPRVDNEDPCARFSKQLKKIGKGAREK